MKNPRGSSVKRIPTHPKTLIISLFFFSSVQRERNNEAAGRFITPQQYLYITKYRAVTFFYLFYIYFSQKIGKKIKGNFVHIQGRGGNGVTTK